MFKADDLRPIHGARIARAPRWRARVPARSACAAQDSEVSMKPKPVHLKPLGRSYTAFCGADLNRVRSTVDLDHVTCRKCIKVRNTPR